MHPLSDMPRFIAHRGASAEAPENTIAALYKAKVLGATWVEFDVMLTKDHHPIVIHDDTLDRTTNGRGKVSEHTLAQIQQLDAGEGERVPTLERFIAVAAELDLGINLEIKEQPCRAEIVAEKIYSVLHSLWTSEFKKPLISSFEPACLTAYRRCDPNVVTALIVNRWSPFLLHKLKKLAVSALVINCRQVTPKRVMRLHQAGYSVLAYTVNEIALMQQLFNAGVDSIFTNDLSTLYTQAS